MNFRNFKFNIIIRVAALLVTMVGINYFFFLSQHYLRGGYTIIVLMILVLEFFQYVNKTNKDLSSFFLSIIERDFSTHFSEKKKGGSYAELYRSMNEVTRVFKEIGSEHEVQLNFLALLVDHLRVGIISYDQDEKIQLMNNAMRRILGSSSVPSLDRLKIDKSLLMALREIKPSEKRLVKTQSSGQLVDLAMHASEFKLRDDYYKLVSVQNVKSELEANELDAWQKLIRVLTHEIMNSVTPISSLSGTLLDLVRSIDKNKPLSSKSAENIEKGLDAIKNRSAGLHTFTEAYQSLTKMPAPAFKKVKLEDLIEPIETIYSSELREVGIKLSINNELTGREIIVDNQLLGQVLVNLIKNAKEALIGVKDAKVLLETKQNSGKVEISVADNGPGIAPEILDKIFVPFFTTKQSGSGIGLALSRQIMHAHNGRLEVESSALGTKFSLIF